ncbi:hypothetical protein AB0L75_09370 [Streptomyces sp. NPDC052101]
MTTAATDAEVPGAHPRFTESLGAPGLAVPVSMDDADDAPVDVRERTA